MNDKPGKWLIELGIITLAILILSIFVAGGFVGALIW